MKYGADKNNEDLKARLCGKLLNLSHKTFIEFLADRCENLLPELNHLRGAIVGSYIKNIHTTRVEKRAARRSNFGGRVTRPRILFDASQFQLPPMDFLQGDVQVVKKMDSSYTSYFGAIGSSGNENSNVIHKRPMNLTHLFP